MENQEGVLVEAGGNGLYRGALGVFVGLGTPFRFSHCSSIMHLNGVVRLGGYLKPYFGNPHSMGLLVHRGNITNAST